MSNNWLFLRNLGIGPLFIGILNQFVIEPRPGFVLFHRLLPVFGFVMVFGGQIMYWKTRK